MRDGIVRVAAVAALIGPTAASAGSVTLDFNGLVHGEVVNTQFQPQGVTLSVDNLGGGPDVGVAFDTTLTGTRDPDLEDPFTGGGNLPGTTPMGNLLIIQENSNGLDDGIANKPDDEAGRPAGTLTFDFDRPITSFGFDLADVEGSVEFNGGYFLSVYTGGAEQATVLFADLIDPGSAFYDPTIAFADNSLNRVAPFTVANLGLTNPFDRVVIGLGGSGGVDNVRFVVVPLPSATWAGLALLGVVAAYQTARRRRLS